MAPPPHPPLFSGGNPPPSGGGNKRPPYNRGPRAPREDAHRRNDRIRVPEVRVIGPAGQQLGVMDTIKATNLARECGMDLVEIAPTAIPPVCKICDYGKYLYEESKKQQQ